MCTHNNMSVYNKLFAKIQMKRSENCITIITIIAHIQSHSQSMYAFILLLYDFLLIMSLLLLLLLPQHIVRNFCAKYYYQHTVYVQHIACTTALHIFFIHLFIYISSITFVPNLKKCNIVSHMLQSFISFHAIKSFMFDYIYFLRTKWSVGINVNLYLLRIC